MFTKTNILHILFSRPSQQNNFNQLNFCMPCHLSAKTANLIVKTHTLGCDLIILIMCIVVSDNNCYRSRHL